MAFHELLEALLQRDNTVRNDAEASLQNMISQDPFSVLSQLASAILAAEKPDVRRRGSSFLILQVKLIATVLFRRYSVRSPLGEDEPLFGKLSAEQAESCKSLLLAAFGSVNIDAIRNKVTFFGNFVCLCCRLRMPFQMWPSGSPSPGPTTTTPFRVLLSTGQS
jgi:hypothetical protein